MDAEAEEKEGEKLYTWETKYERTWEGIREDAEGLLKAEDEAEAYKIKRRKLFQHPASIRLGMMRHMFVIVDCSQVMSDKDLKPNRLTCTLKVLEEFVNEFFDQNPISQLGLINTKDGKAERVLDLNGNTHVLTKALSGNWTPSGEVSLQNALSLAMNGLKHIPSHASREVLVIMGSLTSCDPGNIFTTIEEISRQSIRVSIIGLAAEVRLCKLITQKTQGVYSVIMSESHFRDLIVRHCRPPPAKANTEASLLKMGFPTHLLNGPLTPCLCHLEKASLDMITTDGYFCPQCNSKYCELPVTCQVCGLTLVKAPHLARSYCHLFPLPAFKETPSERFCTILSCTTVTFSHVSAGPFALVVRPLSWRRYTPVPSAAKDSAWTVTSIFMRLCTTVLDVHNLTTVCIPQCVNFVYTMYNCITDTIQLTIEQTTVFHELSTSHWIRTYTLQSQATTVVQYLCQHERDC